MEYTSRYSLIVDRASRASREEREQDALKDPIKINKPEKPKRWEVCLSGAGGQGLLLAGVVLAESAAKYSGLKAVQTQSYGPEARGGASKSEVVIDTKDIHYPKVRNGDVLLALTDEAFNKYIGSVKKGGLIVADKAVLDASVAEFAADYKIYHLPIVDIARSEVGRVQTTNMVALGVINSLVNIVPEVSLENAVLARVPKGTESTNKKALSAGKKLANGAEALIVQGKTKAKAGKAKAGKAKAGKAKTAKTKADKAKPKAVNAKAGSKKKTKA